MTHPENLYPYVEKDKLKFNKIEIGEMVLHQYYVSQSVRYNNEWDEILLKCRTLIIDTETNEIVGRNLNKFFNLGEQEETRVENLDSPDYVIEKLDGSCVLAFFYGGKWQFATKKSHNSEQALWAEKYFYDNGYDQANLDKNCTYVFEAIYPDNRHVVDYGLEKGLYLLGIINNKTKYDYSWGEIRDWIDEQENKYDIAFDSPEELDLSLEELIEKQKEWNGKEFEGVVLQYTDDDGQVFRIKVKGDDYFKLHNLWSNCTPLSFWRLMDQGRVKDDCFTDLDDNFRLRALKIANDLERAYLDAYDDCYSSFENIKFSCSDPEDQSEFGQKVQKAYSNDLKKGAIFCLRNGEPIDEIIHKMIRPDNNKIENAV